ncbi:S8 family serine peptidase [Paenibacillus sp. SYP-B3998]|uniref:S8 family serine peptidase n=1 Tax=Paenibacillus sp. SYP-B3998 TaxID=2678564 RepID=A0A6G4A0I0_9BACL|nr:S8 family serine peptidase [Paenibacillus sp. SYP-B3998]NEW07329.1 S8 family serine peptidase [Paenibacillus sp. SYP-B3998]
MTGSLFKRLILIITFSLIISTVLPLSSSKVKANSVSQEVSQTSIDVVPGQILVKYKHSPAISSSSFGAKSISPQISNLKFPEDTNISDKIEELQKDPNVEYAEPVYKFYLNKAPQSGTVTQSIYFDRNNMGYMENWGKTVTELTYASNNTPQQLSSQVVVAVLDTGIDLTHMDLKNSILQGYDFINNNNTPQDDNGHGTHVSGIIAAKAHDNSGFTGVAPGTKIMPIKVLDQNGVGTTVSMIAGIQYAIDHKANIINLSLGTSGNSKVLHDLIKQAVNSNILVVAATGNESSNWINNESGQLDNSQTDTRRKASKTNYPALYDEVISVGAIEQLDDTSLTVADFSNTLKVDVVAPGVNIYSTYLKGEYRVYSGSSQATPFVSGLAALIKANNPRISVANLTSLIENTATPMPNLNLPFDNVDRYGNNFLGNKDFYGHGLINGKIPFTLPRLEIVPIFGTDNTVTLNVYDKDIHGDKTDLNFYVSLYNFSSAEDSIYRNAILSSDLNVNGSLVHVVDGKGSISFHLSASTPDAYHYIFYVDDDSYREHIRSNSIDLVQKPSMPQVDRNSGLYHDNIKVALSSAPGSEIGYALLNNDNDSAIKNYTGPITINKNSTLVAFSLKNHVYSDTAIYTYTFAPPTNPPVAGGGFAGGGGGGGGSSQLPPTLNADGKMTYDLQPGYVDLLIAINSDSNEVILDARTKEKIDILTVQFGADIIQKATKRNKSIIIRSNEATLTIQPNTFNVENEASKIRFKVSYGSVPSIPNFKAVSSIYDFSLTEGESQIAKFKAPIQVTFAYDTTKVQNPNNLGVYVLDEQSGAWNSVGGTLDGTGQITASLPHFSKYAVLEKTSTDDKGPVTFTDIQSHWAQKEIEQLARKQIIDGMDDASFKPDSNMTRAQFVMLLSKALKLQSHGSALTFADVASDSWYKESVYAAYEANIVNGVSDHNFAPTATITREQMAVMLVNAYLYTMGEKLEQIAITQEVKYSDEGSISDWARSYVRIASGLGLLNGSNEGDFSPGKDTSRAESAVVIYRLLNKINR